MPSPKKCAKKFKKGSKDYNDCINYAGSKKPKGKRIVRLDKKTGKYEEPNTKRSKYNINKEKMYNLGQKRRKKG